MRVIIFLIGLICACIILALITVNVPSITYPDKIVNVKKLKTTNVTFSFDIRCDVVSDMMFVGCAYVGTPICSKKYIVQPYTFGIIQCDTDDSLSDEFSVQLDLSLNRIALVFSVFMGVVLILIGIVAIMIYCQCQRQEYESINLV